MADTTIYETAQAHSAKVAPFTAKVTNKIHGLLQFSGTSDTFTLDTDPNGDFIISNDVFNAFSRARELIFTVKHDGQNVAIALMDGKPCYCRRYDWRHCVAWYKSEATCGNPVTNTIASLFTKFNAKGVKVEMVTDKYPTIANYVAGLVSDFQLVLIGNHAKIPQFASLTKIMIGKQHASILKPNQFVSGEIENGAPNVIYMPDLTVNCLDVVCHDQITNNMYIKQAVPLADILGTHNIVSCEELQNTSPVQGDKYGHMKFYRKGVVTVIAHGAVNCTPDRFKMVPTNIDEYNAFVHDIYKWAIAFATGAKLENGHLYPPTDDTPQREGIVINVVTQNDESVLFKINAGHLEVYAKIFCPEMTNYMAHRKPKQYLFC